MQRAWLRYLVAWSWLVLAVPVALAANASRPHPHKGVLKLYTELPPLQLSDADLVALRAGKPVFRQTEAGNGGRGLAIFKVNAPRRTTWDTINAFEQYPRWIDHLRSTRVYRRDGGNIGVAFVIAGMGFSVEYFIHHDYHHEDTWGTWTLDYSRASDLDDSVGFWRVTPWQDDPANQSLVEYSVDVQVKGWIPGFIRSQFTSRGLREATQWLKLQAEARQRAGPVSAAPAGTALGNTPTPRAVDAGASPPP